MAAPDLRIVRRPKGSRRALTAASQMIDNPSQTIKSSMSSGNRNGWQELAWDMLDLVGELRYYVGWRASSCSRARLIASEIDEDTGLPTGGISEDAGPEGERVVELVKSIAGGPLGQAQLVKRAIECLTVPGEVWIAVVVAGPGSETWYALNTTEIHRNPNGVVIDLPDGTKYTMNLPTDSLFRVWNPRPRKASEADSPVRACLDSLREIVRTTKTISNASKSRLIGNGVVFVPHEMSLPSVQAPVSAGKPGDPPPLPLLAGTPAVQQLQDLLFQVAQVAYDDEDSMAALIPMFAGVPADLIQKVSHLKFDNSVTDIAIKTRNDAIARLAMGLDVSPERLLGLGANSNHWSAWQIGDEDVRLHIMPPMETLVQAINDQLFHKALQAEGIEIPGEDPKYILWYDVSDLTADPDNSDRATLAFDRGAITAEAYREFLGLGDAGYDFTTIEGWQAWATDRVSQDATLLPELLPLLTQIQGLDFPAPQAALPPGQQPIEEPGQDQPTNQTGTPDTEEDPGAPSGQNRIRSDVELAVIDVYAARALELAGKRLRTRADYDRLRSVPMHDTHRILGPVDPTKIPDLIKGWDDTVTYDLLNTLGLDGSAFRLEVRRRVQRELTASRQVVDA